MKARSPLHSFLIGFLALLISPAVDAQEETKPVDCFEVVEAMNFALQGMPSDGVTAISLKDRDETRYVLFVALSKLPSDGQNTSALWRLIERQGDSLLYCLSGAGETLEVLESLDAIPGFDSEFGLPGTSKRRCNDASDGPLGSFAVRSWANKELGPSLVQHFGSPFKGSAFTVLLANDSTQGKYPWIILQRHENRNCYFARGDDSTFSEEFSLREELIQDPSTLAPLK